MSFFNSPTQPSLRSVREIKRLWVFTPVVRFSWFFMSGPKKKMMHLVLVPLAFTVIFKTEPKNTKQKQLLCNTYFVTDLTEDPKQFCVLG